MTGSRRIARLQRRVAQQNEVQQSLIQKVVGYCRVSTDEQANNGYGLEAQEKAIRSFAESQGYELIDIVIDAGVSGVTKPEERPGFQRILRLAEDKAFGILLVWRFDRLSRDLVHAVTTVNLLREKYGVALRSVIECLDTASPMGQTIFALLAGMASQERLAIVQRTVAGKREKASKGGFAGGPAPYGYAKDKDGGLQVVSEEAEVVRRIYSLREQGSTYQAIADILNRDGIPGKRGGKWYAASIRYLLDNKKYEGTIEYLFHGEEHVLSEGQHKAILPKVC